jgi:hypothetical protein
VISALTNADGNGAPFSGDVVIVRKSLDFIG